LPETAERTTVVVATRLKRPERELVDRAATFAGLSVSAFARHVLIATARSILEPDFQIPERRAK
jgi:uncharacterized protein (DUF1778 family)